MPSVTFRIDPDLHNSLSHRASMEGRTLSAEVKAALRAHLGAGGVEERIADLKRRLARLEQMAGID